MARSFQQIGIYIIVPDVKTYSKEKVPAGLRIATLSYALLRVASEPYSVACCCEGVNVTRHPRCYVHAARPGDDGVYRGSRHGTYTCMQSDSAVSGINSDMVAVVIVY